MKNDRLYRIVLGLLLNLGAEFAVAAEPHMLMNFGSGGGWYEPDTNGQGFSFDIVPESNQLVAYWFTYPEMGGTREWYISQGDINGAVVDLVIYRTENGLFDLPSDVQLDPVGSAHLEFTSCSEAHWSYVFETSGLSGDIELDRLGSTQLCEQFLASASLEAVSDRNAWVNLAGAWLFEGCVQLGSAESHGDERLLFDEISMVLEIDHYASTDCSGPVTVQVLELEMQRIDKTMARLGGQDVIANRYLLTDPQTGQEIRQLWYVDDSGQRLRISHGMLDSAPDEAGFPTELHPLYFTRP